MLRILRAARADLDSWMAPEPHGRVASRVADSAPCAPSPSWIVIIGRGRMIVQRLVNRRGLAIDREPQPGDFRDDVGLSVDPQSRIVSPRPTRVKVGRRGVSQGSTMGCSMWPCPKVMSAASGSNGRGDVDTEIHSVGICIRLRGMTPPTVTLDGDAAVAVVNETGRGDELDSVDLIPTEPGAVQRTYQLDRLIAHPESHPGDPPLADRGGRGKDQAGFARWGPINHTSKPRRTPTSGRR